MKMKYKNIFTVLLIAVAVICLIVGIYEGQVKTVFIKAANI